MFGALGNTWRYNFYMGMQNDMNLDRPDFLFTPLNQRYTPYKLPHMYVQGSHAFAMFYANALHEKRGIPVVHAHITLTTFTRFAQNCTVGCMLVLLVLLDMWLHLSLTIFSRY